MKALATLITLLLIGAVAWAISAVYLPYGGQPARVEVVEIRKGESASEICRQLESLGVVSSASQFYWVGRLLGKWNKIRVGEYQVSSAENAFTLFATLTSGLSIKHRFTVAEGRNLYEIARELEEKKLGLASRFIQTVRDPAFLTAAGLAHLPSAEGYLYPETYLLDRTMSEPDIARLMIQLFLKNWDSAWDQRAKQLGLTRHQVIILASIIEKETGAPAERPMISSVFHNRLRKRMRLQSDPTTIYGIWERYDGNIRKSDLSETTPYNTYAIPALPVGPISNPGREALLAALNPATTEYLFFVSHNDGTHEFTRSYGEHSSAVKRFQLDAKERLGKSWRDLKPTQTK